MTTSGSQDFSVSRDNLLEDALRAAGALGVEDSASSAQKTHAARVLNMIVKARASDGISLWARTTGYVLPFTGSNSTTMSSTGGHITTSYTQTTLSAAAASGATSIVVTSATGFGDTYYVGVELTDGSMSWHVQSGAASGTTITLTAGLSGAAASGNYVYVYQTKLNRAVRVVEAYRHDQSSGVDVPVDVVPFSDYTTLSDKTDEGDPLQVTYDPQLNSGTIYVWPRFIDGKTVLVLIFQRQFEDFDAAGDTPDFPQEWYLYLFYALAVALAPTYGLPVADRQLLRGEMKSAYEDVKGNEPEEGSFRIVPRDG